MRILIDECLPKKLKQEFSTHTVKTVQEKKWSSIKNGELLRMASDQFDVFITVDRNLEHQQNLTNFAIAIIVLFIPNNRLETILPRMPKLHEVLETIQPHELVRINHDN